MSNAYTPQFTNYKESNPVLDSLIKKFFKEHELVGTSITSYDRFLDTLVPNCIYQYNEGIIGESINTRGQPVKFNISFSNVRYQEPRLKGLHSVSNSQLINRAILSNTTYLIPLVGSVEIKQTNLSTDQQIVYCPKSQILLAEIPLMIGSKYDLTNDTRDEWEHRGYFIINGTQRFILNYEEMASNILLSRLVNSRIEGLKAEVFIISSDKGFRLINKVIVKKKYKLEFVCRSVKYKINPLILLKALGVSDKSLIENIADGNSDLEFILLPQLSSINSTYKSHKDLLTYVKNVYCPSIDQDYKDNKFNNIIHNQFLFHIGSTPEALKVKVNTLMKMINEALLIHRKEKSVIQIDSLVSKRIKSTGALMEEYFYYLFAQVIEGAVKITKSSVGVKPMVLLKTSIICQKLISALATGTWIGGKDKLTTVLDRTNKLALLTGLRRVISPLNKDGRFDSARIIHESHYGRFCPLETPPNAGVGLILSLAVGAKISSFIDNTELITTLFLSGVLHKEATISSRLVLLNGLFIGYSSLLSCKIRNFRDSNLVPIKHRLPPEVSIYLVASNTGTVIHINSNEGRILRPLLRLVKEQPVYQQYSLADIQSMSLKDIIDKRIICYLDAQEEKERDISANLESIDRNHTLCEIRGDLLAGLILSSMPFVEYNNPGKLTGAIRLLKNAVSNFIPEKGLKRGYTRVYKTLYNDTPLGLSKNYVSLGLDKIKSGSNIICAINSQYGFNSSDAIIFNKESIDRGLFMLESIKGYSIEVSRLPGPIESSLKRDRIDYSLVEKTGLPPLNQVFSGQVALLGDIGTIRVPNIYGLIVKANNAYVKSITLSEAPDNKFTITMVIAEQKSLEVGDKVSSQHGQKSIVSALYPRSRLPYTKEGLTPDVFLTPYAVAQRMTMGHLLDVLVGGLSLITGQKYDSTIFGSISETQAKFILKSIGLSQSGVKTFYNPDTGLPFETELFTGCINYVRLNFLIDDRLQARGKGAIQLVTGQPTEGKSNEGGLKLGEMERDILSAYGASNLLLERFCSDTLLQKININRKTIAMDSSTLNLKQNLVNIELPPAFKLFVNELEAINIKTEFEISNEL